jgi:Tol biopolymer transport system component
MTEHRTVEERISLWLEDEAAGRLPDHVLDATFDRTRAIRHRPGPSAWRPFTMSRPISALIAFGAAAIVIVAGAAMLRPSSQTPAVGNGGSPVVTPSPTAESTPTLAPSAPSGPPLGLAIVNLDGSIRQELALPRDAWTADLSADGMSVIFRTSDKSLGLCGGCTDIHRLAIVRVGATQGTYVYPDLPDDDRDRKTMISPVWSPDGKRVVYSETGVDGNVDLFVADLETGGDIPTGLTSAHSRRLTTDPAVDEFPAWTPDGKTIVYDNSGAHPLDDSLFSDTMEIWSVPAAGGTPVRLTNNTFIDTQPDVAADGTVAFWRGGVIFAMDSDGSNQHQLKKVPRDVGFNPRWSPDGRRLALLQYDPRQRATFEPSLNLPPDLPLLKVIVVDVAAGAVTEVGPRVPSDINPVSWTPDGSALLVYRYDQPS